MKKISKASIIKLFAAFAVIAAVVYYNLKFEIVMPDELTAYGADNGFKVTYNVNGGTGNAPADNNIYNEDDEVLVLQGSSVSRNGYTFDGWSLVKDGDGTTYQPGNRFWISRDITLYAKWLRDEFQITYDIAGASGTAPSDNRSYITGDTAAAARDDGFSMTGYVFKGWSTQANGGGTVYQPGETITVNGNINLFAVWEQEPPVETMSIIPVATKVAEAASETPAAQTEGNTSSNATKTEPQKAQTKPTETKSSSANINTDTTQQTNNVITLSSLLMPTDGCCCCGNYVNPYSGDFGYQNQMYQPSNDISGYTYKAVSTLSVEPDGPVNQTRYLVYSDAGVLLGSIYLIPESYVEMQQNMVPLSNGYAEVVNMAHKPTGGSINEYIDGLINSLQELKTSLTAANVSA